jgi:hypothetical protein
MAAVNSRGGTICRFPIRCFADSVRIQALQFSQENGSLDVSKLDSVACKRNDDSQYQRKNSQEQRNLPLFFSRSACWDSRISAAREAVHG